MLFLLGLLSLVPHVPAQDTSCTTQSHPVSAEVWGQIPPPPGGVTVAFFDQGTVQVGLNHIDADAQNLTHRWRSFVPWMSSDIVSAFPFQRAIQSPATRMPLFYVSHTVAALDASRPEPQWVHLLRADSEHNTRVIQITSGLSAFSFHPGFTAREEVPLRFQVLSSAVYTIQPEKPLENGQYLVIFGPSALSGFEFQIACSDGHATHPER